MSYPYFLLVISFFVLTECTNYQIWKQCDPQWANNQLGFSYHTICQSGSLVTSVTMAVSSLPSWVNPAGMNNWLREMGGYENGDSFIWGSISLLGLKFIGFQTRLDWISLHLVADDFLIGNVDSGTHWVLITGVHGRTTATINDPKYERTQIPMTQISKYAVYQRSKPSTILQSYKGDLLQYISQRSNKNKRTKLQIN